MRFTTFCVASFCLALPAAARMPSTLPRTLPNCLTVVDWKQIRSEYERHRHGMFPDGNGYNARGFEQQWLARFDGRGVSVEPDEGAWRWGLDLVGVTGRPRVTADVNRITYRWSADLDEWFLNDTRGLEHGFTLKKRHEIRLAVRGELRPRTVGVGLEFVDDSGTARVRYSGLAAWDANGRALPAKMVARNGLVTLTVDDRGAQYPVTVDPIAQQAYIKASNTGSSDWFGFSVAASQNTVVVGSPYESSNATGVNGNQANDSMSESGAAYVFVRNGISWAQQAYLKASNTDAGDQFGFSVAASGDTIVVAAWGESSSATGVNGNQADNNASHSGAAYVFVRNGTSWAQQAYLKASNTAAFYYFGRSAGLSGDTIVVGSGNEDSNATGVDGVQTDRSATTSGAAYVFVRSGTAWTQQAYLKASNAEKGDGFGSAVAASGDTIVVGAPGESSNSTGENGNQADNSTYGSGAAYVFVRSGVIWTQQAYLKASNAGSGDGFGSPLAIYGDTVVVGAPEEGSNARGVNGNQADNSAPESGAAYVFARNGTTWTQKAYLKASNTEAGVYFGNSVAVSGDTVVVGSPAESSDATGVSGNQQSTNAGWSGATYVFVRSGVTWAQQAYVKASNPGADDTFGGSVGVSGNTVVIGATGESSNATGVNGNQADNSAFLSGAAYTFVGNGVTVTSSPVGMVFNSTGAGCEPGTGYVTPITLNWTPGSSCSLTFGSTVSGPGGVPYNFQQWDDGSTGTTRAITAPSSLATYTATFAPPTGAQPISADPSSGTNSHQYFTFVFRHAASANNILYAQLLFTKSELGAANACYISYDPTANVFYLLSDDATQWYGLQGGSANNIGNAQCSIYGTGSGSSKSGTDLSVNVDIRFRSRFGGQKTIYQLVGDTSGGTSGWQAMGIWNDTGDQSLVELISASPYSGSGTTQFFTAIVRDSRSYMVAFTQLLINGTLSGFNGCYIHFDHASNTYFLLNDAGTEWSGLPAGTANSVSNSQCTLHGPQSRSSEVGSDLGVYYYLDFSPSFAGTKQIYMQAADQNGDIEVWHQMGTYTP